MLYDKKGMSKTIWILATFVTAMVIVILILVNSGEGISQVFGGIGERIDDLGDCDAAGATKQ